jgi:hypothetical protein
MYLVRTLPLVAALSVATIASLSHSEEPQPQTTPTRDVDITYQITRPGLPAIVERRRWLASQQLRRVDGSDKSATIFDQNREELTPSMGQITPIAQWSGQLPSGCPRKKGRC